MRATTEVEVKHAVLAIIDRSSDGALPETIGDSLVSSTPACVVVGTMSELDGATRLEMTDDLTAVPGCTLVFDGVLQTPGRMLSIVGVPFDVLLQMSVAAAATRVRVWVNHDRWPDHLVVQCG